MSALDRFLLLFTPVWRGIGLVTVGAALAGLAAPEFAGGAAVVIYLLQAGVALCVFYAWRHTPHWKVGATNDQLFHWSVGVGTSAAELALGLVAAWQGLGWLAAAAVLSAVACLIARAVWLVFDR